MAAALDTPLLVMHDRDDPTVPWAEGAAIATAWRGAELVTTSGLGHRDIVRDPDVVARAVAFLSASASTETKPLGTLDTR
jgi:pimeloyl-ACP methyl ester carboxylesterase